MIKKVLSGLALILALSSCSNQDKLQNIDYLGAFKKDNSIYFKLDVEGVGIRYLVDHGSNSYDWKNAEGYVFPRESHLGNNQLMIQFKQDEDGLFDETRYVNNNTIYQLNQEDTKILTNRVLNSNYTNQMKIDVQKLYNIRNSNLNDLTNDEQTLMNLDEFKAWILRK